MRIKDMNPKLRKRKIQTWFRAGMQLLFFILFPSMFTAAFNGVKYIFTQIGWSLPLYLDDFSVVLPVHSEALAMRCMHYMCHAAVSLIKSR